MSSRLPGKGGCPFFALPADHSVGTASRLRPEHEIRPRLRRRTSNTRTAAAGAPIGKHEVAHERALAGWNRGRLSREIDGDQPYHDQNRADDSAKEPFHACLVSCLYSPV